MMEALSYLLIWLFPLAIIIMAGTLIIALILFFMRQGRSPRVPRSILWTFATSAILAVFAWVSVIYPFLQRGRRERTLADMKVTTDYLLSYKEIHKDFPNNLIEAIPTGKTLPQDGWSHDFHYEHHKGAFILVSYGSDGKPDGSDYWMLREQGIVKDLVDNFKCDLVTSDRGWHRVGGE